MFRRARAHEALAILLHGLALALATESIAQGPRPSAAKPPAGEFVWHSQADTDEVFIDIDGQMAIEFRDGAVQLAAGEMFVVPKGVEHRPVAHGECRVMLVEPRGVVNTGEAGGAYTAGNDVWV